MSMSAPVHDRLFSAKSDYLISTLRSLLNSPFEYHLQWALARSQNGCVLKSPDAVMQALFFAKPDNPDPRDLSIRLRDMSVRIHGRDSSGAPWTVGQIEPLLHKAEADFDRLLVNPLAFCPDQVARLHFLVRRLGFDSHSANACEEALRNISRLLPGTLLMEPHDSPEYYVPDAILPIETEREAEVLLPRPTPEHEVVRLLQPVLPDLSNDLFGRGQFLLPPDAALKNLSDLTFLVVYARHF